MFKRISAMRVTAFTAFVMAGGALGATRDDELLVDPTMPLSIAFSSSDAESVSSSDSSGLFGLLGAFTSYELSSILIRAGDRIAVINEERVRVGDKVGSAIVTEIEADHVTLNVGGKREMLELYENSIKTLVKGDE